MDKKKPSVKKTAIYVDVEDDLTSVISKVKSSSGQVIALVPPRRIGILQSAVNLKLLAKEAKSEKKELILISSDKALGALAAVAKISVAANLTSEPKLADIPKAEEAEETITGFSQTIDELDKQNRAAESGDDKEVTAAVKAISDDDDINDDDETPIGVKNKPKPKIPNFLKFRKWFILGGVGILGIAGVLVWLIFFATGATITITANTSGQKIDQPVTLVTDGPVDATKNQLRLVAAEPVKKTNQIEFTATGKKDVGDKATGSVIIYSNRVTGSDTPIDAGTTLSTGNTSYVTNANVTVPGSTVCGHPPQICAGSVTVNVTAVALGSDFNIKAGAKLSVAGYGASDIFAEVNSGGITGGSKETVTVVQQSDIDKITDTIKKDTGSETVRSELSERFNSDTIAIEDSFKVDFGDVKSSPAVGEKADKATATLEVTYTMHGVPKDDVSAVLMQAAIKKLGNLDNQMVFDNGFGAVQLLSYSRGEGSNASSLRLVTNAKIGPKLDEDKIKSDAVGKKANEISSAIKKINGVEEVTVKFFPFWVNAAPDIDRIHIVKNGL